MSYTQGETIPCLSRFINPLAGIYEKTYPKQMQKPREKATVSNKSSTSQLRAGSFFTSFVAVRKLPWAFTSVRTQIWVSSFWSAFCPSTAESCPKHVTVYAYIYLTYGFWNIRTGILDYLRKGFPWPPQPFKHTEYANYSNIHLYKYVDETGVHTTSGALWSGPSSTYLNVVTEVIGSHKTLLRPNPLFHQHFHSTPGTPHQITSLATRNLTQAKHWV